MNVEEKIKKRYFELRGSGMFWEYFPDLSGNWMEDKEIFIKEHASEVKDSPSLKKEKKIIINIEFKNEYEYDFFRGYYAKTYDKTLPEEHEFPIQKPHEPIILDEEKFSYEKKVIDFETYISLKEIKPTLMVISSKGQEILIDAEGVTFSEPMKSLSSNTFINMINAFNTVTKIS